MFRSVKLLAGVGAFTDGFVADMEAKKQRAEQDLERKKGKPLLALSAASRGPSNAAPPMPTMEQVLLDQLLMTIKMGIEESQHFPRVVSRRRAAKILHEELHFIRGIAQLIAHYWT